MLLMYQSECIDVAHVSIRYIDDDHASIRIHWCYSCINQDILMFLMHQSGYIDVVHTLTRMHWCCSCINQIHWCLSCINQDALIFSCINWLHWCCLCINQIHWCCSCINQFVRMILKIWSDIHWNGSGLMAPFRFT